MNNIAVWHTGHEISYTVCKSVAESLNADLRHVSDYKPYDVNIAYGILRGTADIFKRSRHWFEIDKGFIGARHYDGNYRISYKGTQPKFDPSFIGTHNIKCDPWREGGEYILICPPTDYVCEFFNIDYTQWLMNAVRQCDKPYVIRDKSTKDPLSFYEVDKVITFNSSVGVEAVLKGIQVISDPIHSLVGNFTSRIGNICGYERTQLCTAIENHQFKLGDAGALCRVLNHYLSTSAGMPEKQLQAM